MGRKDGNQPHQQVVRVIRSLQWPKVNRKLDLNLKPQSHDGRTPRHMVVRAADSPFSAKARSLEAVLAAVGPEESVAKTEIASALKRVREQEVASFSCCSPDFSSTSP